MANPAQQAQIGYNGAARYFGIPALAVQFLGNDGTTNYVLKVFGSVEKSGDAAVQIGVDNANEVNVINRTQRKRSVKFSAKAESTTATLAKTIADNLPIKMDIVSIGHMASGTFSVAGSGVVDSQIETASAIVESAPSARYSPEGELVVDFDLTIYLNPDGTIRTFAAVS